MQSFALLSGLILIGFALVLNTGVMLVLVLRILRSLRFPPHVAKQAAPRAPIAWSR